MVVMFLLLTVFVMFFLYLKFPQIEAFFTLYTNGALFVVYGLMKGCNWGECRKCGKDHGAHPRGMLGKKNPNGGCTKAWNKGLKGWLSPEHREAIARSNSTRYNSPETRYKMGSGVRGKPSHRKGKHLPILHRLNITFGMRKSKVFRERVLRGLYDLPENVQFSPASKYEHVFARMVLIEGGVAYGFITHSRLRERPEWIKNNRNEKSVPLVI